MPAHNRITVRVGALLFACLACLPVRAQQNVPDWQREVRKCADAQDWSGALSTIDREVAQAPQDADVLSWRARILTWSGRLNEAEQQYLQVVRLSPNDPDNWLGLSNVYAREGRTQDALRAVDRAVQLDPKRADLREARARILRATGDLSDARAEFQRALDLDPSSVDARVGLRSLRSEAKHELRIGQDTDLFNFAGPNNGQWVSLVSHWTSQWATSFAGSVYQRGGIDAGKFVGSVTAREHRWGALTVGGAVGHDNGVIPKSEAFFELDHGFKIGEIFLVRGVELTYGQHWYWYSSAHILALTGATIVYLPRDWRWSLAVTGARSTFPGIQPDWRPSGISRLGFPLARWREQNLSGNVFFAVGTESFAQVDQIGTFASHTYGGGLRYDLSPRQYFTGSAGFQQRTQNRTDTSFGFTYGIHF